MSHFEFDVDATNSAAAPDGTLVGGATISSDARVGAGALQLSNGYVDTTTAGLPSGSVGIDAGTVAYWYKNTGARQSNGGVLASLNEADGTALLMYYNGAGGLEVFLRGAGNETTRWRMADSSGSAGSPDQTWADGEFHHVAAAWTLGADSASHDLDIYIDGVSQPLNFAGNSLLDSTVFSDYEFPVTLGARNSRGAIDFVTANAIFDDFRIYDGQLSQSEILALPGGVPEPATAAALGLGALAMLRRRTA